MLRVADSEGDRAPPSQSPELGTSQSPEHGTAGPHLWAGPPRERVGTTTLGTPRAPTGSRWDSSSHVGPCWSQRSQPEGSQACCEIGQRSLTPLLGNLGGCGQLLSEYAQDSSLEASRSAAKPQEPAQPSPLGVLLLSPFCFALWPCPESAAFTYVH